MEEARDELFEEEHFPGLGDEGFHGVGAVLGFGVGQGEEVVWGVAREAELHEGVLQLFGGDFFAGLFEDGRCVAFGFSFFIFG